MGASGDDPGGAPAKAKRRAWFGGTKKEKKKEEGGGNVEEEEEGKAVVPAYDVKLKEKKVKETRAQRAARRKREAKRRYGEVMTEHKRRIDRGFVECYLCFEHAEERACCDACLCAHCYQFYCPSCGIAVREGRPRFEPEAEEKTVTAGEETIDDGVEQYSELSAKRERGRQLAVEVQQELMECRLCLNPGERRGCCGEVFCDKCYHRRPKCPSCRRPTAGRGLMTFAIGDPSAVAVFCGVCFTGCFAALLACLLAVAVVTERSDLRTLHGYRCYGFFPTCDRLKCVELYSSKDGPPRNPDGSLADLTLPSIASWRDCDLATVAKVVGSTCVFDQDLFIQSGHKLGYDFCTGTNAKHQDSQLDGGEARDAAFSNGVYVFDDDFDLWPNATAIRQNGRASGKWEGFIGAQVDEECGFHSPRGGPGSALHFFGPDFREVVTEALDVRWGGRLTFRLLLAPISDDPKCISNFGAAVSAFYRLAGKEGSDWVKIRDFEAEEYGLSRDFNLASVALPPGGWSNATQLKISQPAFLRESDHWAIDSVNVFHAFPPEWKRRAPFQDGTLRDSREDVAVAQCCLATDQCALVQEEAPYKASRAGCEFRGGCGDVRRKMVDGAERRDFMKRGIVRLNGAQFYLSLAGVALFYNFVYWLIKRYFTTGICRALLPKGFRSRLPPCCGGPPRKKPDKVFVAEGEEDEEDEDSFEVEADYDEVLKTTFDLDVSLPWQRKFAAMTVVPFALCFAWALSRSEAWILYTPLRGWGENLRVGAVWLVPVPEVAILALATWLDLRVLYGVLRYNVCVLERWIPMVHVNTDPLVNSLDIACVEDEPERRVPLTSMEEMLPFTETQCRVVAAYYVFIAQPWALFALGLDSLRLPYDGVDRVLAASVGALVIVRAWAGSDVLVKAVLGAFYAFSRTGICRKQLGNALCDTRTRWITFYTTAAVVTTGMVLMPMDQSGHVQTRKIEVFYGFCFVLIFAVAYGLVAGCVQTLPVTPDFRLTKVGEGHYFTYIDRTKCPCYHSFGECSTMHSRRRIVVLFVEDQDGFIAKLKGDAVDG